MDDSRAGLYKDVESPFRDETPLVERRLPSRVYVGLRSQRRPPVS